MCVCVSKWAAVTNTLTHLYMIFVTSVASYKKMMDYDLTPSGNINNSIAVLFLSVM